MNKQNKTRISWDWKLLQEKLCDFLEQYRLRLLLFQVHVRKPGNFARKKSGGAITINTQVLFTSSQKLYFQLFLQAIFFPSIQNLLDTNIPQN